MTFTRNEADLEYVRALLHHDSGIVLEPGKEYLVLSRLLPLARRHNAPDLPALLARSRREPAGSPLRRQIVEALTTNETSFFRDLQPFAALRTHVVPALIAARKPQRALDIWSAACSTGQEPYSIAILLRHHFPELSDWRVRIRATDLNHEVLEQAAAGRYTLAQVQRGLPPALLERYFHRHPSGNGDWQLNAEIMRMVEFSPLNLNSPHWPGFSSATPDIDLLCLRNVMIYFADEGRRLVLTRARQSLRHDGYLLLGTAETTQRLNSDFAAQSIARTTFFRPRPE